MERLGIATARMGDHPGALAFFEKALPLARLVGDRQQEANLLWYQGIHHAVLGQRDLAVAKAEEAIAVFKQTGKAPGRLVRGSIAEVPHGRSSKTCPAGPAPRGAGAAPHRTTTWAGRSPRSAMAGQPNDGQAQAKPISGPGLLAMAMSATKAMANFVGSGFKTVTPEIQRKRLETCASCEHHTGHALQNLRLLYRREERDASRRLPDRQVAGLIRSVARQIWEAGVRFRKMLMIPSIMLSLYCGSPLNFFQTGESMNPCQCFLCSSMFSPDTM